MNHYENLCNKWDGVDVKKFLEAEGKLGVLVDIMDLMNWDLK